MAEVHLGSLRHNAGILRQLVGDSVSLLGVIKADAYGHGAIAVARALRPLVQGLAVSLVEEGLELREAEIDGRILVLGGFYGNHHSEVIEAGLTPVVGDPADLDRFAAAPFRRKKSPAHAQGGRVPEAPIDIHLKIDTGMSRLGVPLGQLDRVLQQLAGLPRLRLTGVCTHLSSADTEDTQATLQQLQRFDEALARVRASGMEPALIHVANTAGTVRFPGARNSAVRPGVALYGALPTPAVQLPGLRPVLTLRTRVLALHDIEPGTGVSYGALFRARRVSRIATLPIGYADGYPQHVRGGQVLVRGRRVPVAGAVSMDMLMVDVTDVPGVAIGDDVTLIGSQGNETITLGEVAAWAGTSNYEILCGISKRVPRLYLDADPDQSLASGVGPQP